MKTAVESGHKWLPNEVSPLIENTNITKHKPCINSSLTATHKLNKTSIRKMTASLFSDDTSSDDCVVSLPLQSNTDTKSYASQNVSLQVSLSSDDTFSDVSEGILQCDTVQQISLSTNSESETEIKVFFPGLTSAKHRNAESNRLDKHTQKKTESGSQDRNAQRIAEFSCQDKNSLINAESDCQDKR